MTADGVFIMPGIVLAGLLISAAYLIILPLPDDEISEVPAEPSIEQTPAEMLPDGPNKP